MKKTISLILCALLVFACFSLFAGADEPKTIMVLGDSIALGSGILNSQEGCYGRIVADTNGYGYINRGINGSTSKRLLKDLQSEEFANDVSKADIISLSIGGNDFLQQNVPLLIAQIAVGNYENIDNITESLAENYAEIIGTLKEINPDAVIIAHTLYNPRTDALKEVYGVAVDSVNTCIYNYAQENPGDIEILDVRPIFEGRFDYVAIDTIHPSRAGNVAIATLLLEKLYEMGLGTETEPVIVNAGIDELPFWSDILGFFHLLIEKLTEMLSFA